MDTRAFPTKGNLIANKNTLALASQGYDLMDRKRNILISEIVRIVDEVKEIHDKINKVYAEAYEALEQANVQLGIDTVLDMADAVELEANVSIHMRSVMGTDVPTTAL
ncbi:MAG: V-type ATP synthase subunit D, partial [Parasporobacterium sp.]|nr:V-type ATP synthase subunit D [Parasporobacterium sp.]